LMLMVELPEVAPAGMVGVPTIHVAPVSDCGRAQLIVSAAGNGTAGLVV